jgi:hypothetical protein
MVMSAHLAKGKLARRLGILSFAFYLQMNFCLIFIQVRILACAPEPTKAREENVLITLRTKLGFCKHKKQERQGKQIFQN